ncbi:MAG: hypothetical protein JNN12_03470 [Bacteroidetes Order II. Incertae sedis bacterium]|nr:hypothetical protein [Bacteroidetes Order II. bacterium]
MESWVFYLVGFIIWAILKGISDDQKQKKKKSLTKIEEVLSELQNAKEEYEALANPHQHKPTLPTTSNKKPMGYFSQGKYFDNENTFDQGADYDVSGKDYDQTAKDFDIVFSKNQEEQFENHLFGDHPKEKPKNPTLKIDKPTPTKKPGLSNLLHSPEAAKNAFIFSEIFGTPKSRKR